MRIPFLFLFLLLTACRPTAVETESPIKSTATWLTSLPNALKQAEAEKRAVLVDFTGSDWCIWCRKLKREVFNEPEFRAFADQNLVLVEVDFPKGTPQPEELRKANEELQARFGVEGFPTVLILDAAGKQLAKMSYEPGGAERYVQLLASIPGFPWRKVKMPVAVANPAVEKPAPEVRYDELTLREISGKSLKTALINNQTFSIGSSGRVKLGDKQLMVECQDIRDDSVLILVEGEAQPRELKLKSAEKK